jgi:hypothetical protein
MGFKLENRRSAMAAEQLMAVKGLAFAEPGPSDNGWSHLGYDAIREDLTREQRAALPASKRLEEDLERIRLAAKKNNVKWLGNGPPGATPQQEIDQGRRMGPRRRSGRRRIGSIRRGRCRISPTCHGRA